mgnify:CR=1 FL=1|jgi:transcriptional regulator with XRE-family HTH domain
MNRLREIRKKHQLTLRQLDEQVNINYSQLARIEKGEASLTNQHIEILTKHFAVSADYLLGLSDIPNTKPHQLKYYANTDFLFTLEDIVLRYKHEFITIRFFNDYIKITFDDLNKSEIIYRRVK